MSPESPNKLTLLWLIFNTLINTLHGQPHGNFNNDSNGAVFTRVGTMYTGLAYGHVVMRYNLTSITQRTKHLTELLKFTQGLTLPIENATISDRYFLNWTKKWMKENIQETIDKVNEALDHTTSPGPSRRRKRRRKRQVFVGIAAAAIGAIAGSIITEFSESGVSDVIEQKENVIVATVEDNLIRINQDTRDIKNLKQTLKMVLDDTRRYIMDAKRNTHGVSHLQLLVTIQQTCRSLRDAMDTIESARVGEFLPTMVDHKGLVKALKVLRTKSVMKGYEPSIETSMDMKHLPCTTAVTQDTLHVIVHIPLYQSALDLDLFRYIDHPVQKLKDDLYASIDLEGQPSFLAINRDESKYKEFSAGDLETCYHRNRRYFCPDVPLYSKHRPHCLWALYKHHEQQVKEQCPITFSKLVAKAVRIDQDNFMITDTDRRNELTLSCETNVPKRDHINGTKVVKIERGCRASTTHVAIHHPAFEPDVIIEGLVVNDKIIFADWMPRNNDTEFLETAEELLQQVGKKVPWSDVAALTTFKAKIAAANIVFPHFGNGIFGWIMRAITPVLTVIGVVILIYLVLRCGLPALRKWRAARQRHRATHILNRPQAMSRIAEEEPMEIDDSDDYQTWEKKQNEDDYLAWKHQQAANKVKGTSTLTGRGSSAVRHADI